MNQTEQLIGIFTTDVHLKVRSWDSWLASVTGLAAEVVREVHLLEIFPELETRGLRHCFQRVLSEGKVEKLSSPTYPYLLPCLPRQYSKYFEYMQQQVTIVPLRERDQIIGTIVTIEDLTPQLDRERELSELSEQLKSADESIRVHAAQTLATQSDEGKKEAAKLVEALGDESWRVRQVAIDMLVQRSGPDAVATLVGKIRDQHRNMSVLNSALKALTQIKGDIITPLTELLQLPDEDLRGYVVLALGEQQDRRVIPALMQLINDNDQNVRYNAIEALGKVRAIEAVQLLAKIAESGDFFLAFPALDALKRIGDPSVLPRLVPLLQDELLRDPTIEVLGQLGDETVVEPLTMLLNQPETSTPVLAQAIATLYDRYEEWFSEGYHIVDLTRRFLNAQGMQQLLNALNSANEDELRAIALVLGWLEGEGIEKTLTQLLGKPTVQKEVIKALVRYGPRVVELLIEQLQVPHLETRQAAVVALERIGDQRAVPTLIRMLQENDQETLIISVINALTKIGSVQAFESLLGFVGHPAVAVRQATIAALSAINHPQTTNRAVPLLRDGEPYVRESAVKILGYIGQPGNLESLLTCCHDPNNSVRQAAIENLPYFEGQDERVIPLLAAALETDTPKVRASAARALADIDNNNVLTYLHQSALRDTDAWVRYFAVRALGQRKAVDCWKTLTQIAQFDEANQVRIAAIEALGQVGEVRTVPILARLSQVEEADLAHAALMALGQIPQAVALSPLQEALCSHSLARQLDAIYALGQHREAEAVTILQQVVRADESRQLVQAAIDALVRIATPAAINALIALTANPRWREVGIKALSQLGTLTLEWLANGLKHEQVGIRSAMVEILAQIKHPDAIQQLISALADKEAAVRLAAVTALGRSEINSARSQLMVMAGEDPNLAVRRAAQNILKRT